jgi:hypothetical protein
MTKSCKFYNFKKLQHISPYEGCPHYRRSLQLSKENTQNFQKIYFFIFFLLFLKDVFVHLDPDPAEKKTVPIQIRIHNTGRKVQ